MSDLSLAFAALRKIMVPYASKLSVTRDEGQELYVDTMYIQKNKKPLFFGAVQVKKSYVRRRRAALRQSRIVRHISTVDETCWHASVRSDIV